MRLSENDIESLYTGVIYDAMKQDIGFKHPFVLSHQIGLLHGGKIFGPAFTCRGEAVASPEDVRDSVRIEMLRFMSGGCVKVVANGSPTVAISGDITCLLDARHGAVGCVLDGFVRDLDLIRSTLPGYSVYGRGCSPMDAYGTWQIVEYQRPIVCSGIEGAVRIRPGDFVFADASGALVIPGELRETVLCHALDRCRGEAKIRERLLRGEDLEAVYAEEVRW